MNLPGRGRTRSAELGSHDVILSIETLSHWDAPPGKPARSRGKTGKPTAIEWDAASRAYYSFE